MPVDVLTLSGDPTTLTDDLLAEARATFRGPVLTAADTGYDSTRVIQNGMFDRRPGLIIRCTGVADVVDAVGLARRQDLLVAVRGGGHGIAGHCTSDDCLMIDLSLMRGVWVDPERRRVRVQGGATWGDVDREAQFHGLAVPGGIVSTTGVAGLTLGGGIGWLHRKYGLTCDSLRSAEVVTADGDLVHASESENGDLFWALRGGGGNFGVVTGFEFEAYEVGPIVWNAGVMYAPEDGREVIERWRDWASGAPDEVTSRLLYWSMPDAPQLPQPVQGRDVVIVAAVHAGDPDAGEEATADLRRMATPLADISGAVPYRFAQSAFDFMLPKGEAQSYWKSVYLEDIDDEAADLIDRRGNDRPHPLTLVHVPLMGGATSRVAARETAFGDRSAAYMLSVDGNWLDPVANDTNVAWVREVVEEAKKLPSTSGTYLNFAGDPHVEESDRQAAFGQNLDRLSRVKAMYDPSNRFRLNANIPPAPR